MRPPKLASNLWMPNESDVEGCEHQHNANIHRQPFPESVFKEHNIYAYYDGCHSHHVKRYSYLSTHLSYNPRMAASVRSPIRAGIRRAYVLLWRPERHQATNRFLKSALP
jgi:hypothetical protein